MQTIAQLFPKSLIFLFFLVKQNSPKFQINILKFENLHVASFLHKVLPFSAGTTDLLFGLGKNIDEGIKRLTKNKEALQKGIFYVDIV